jgi:hypothetical protein
MRRRSLQFRIARQCVFLVAFLFLAGGLRPAVQRSSISPRQPMSTKTRHPCALNARGPVGLIDGKAPGKARGFMWRIVGVLRCNQALVGFHIWQ